MILRDGRPEVAEEGEAARGVDIELVGVGDHAHVGVLGHVHGHVGPLEQDVGIVPVERGHGDATTGFDAENHAIDLNGFIQGDDDPVGHFDGVAQSVDPGEKDTEFVAAESGDGVGLAQDTVNSRAHFGQDAVSVFVTEGVIDLLEPVQVEEHDRTLRTVAGPLAHGLLGPVVEARPVG